jgi:apolipoprotein N-acyltransferase
LSGRVVAGVRDIFIDGIATREVNRRNGETIYTRFGDILVFIMMGVLGLGISTVAKRRI